MKQSISIWSFCGPWTLEEKFELAAKHGFQAIEPDLTEDGPIGMETSDDELLQVKALADKHGLELSGLATGLYWGANGASADAATREKAAAILDRQIHCAKVLGIDAILVVPGSVGADFIPDGEVVPYADVWERATDLIRKALPAAEAAGVTICVENVWNKFLLSPLEMKQFIEQFESPHVAVYFDVGNTLATGYPEHWIPVLGKHIKRVHFKDYRRAVGSVDGFCDLLSGDVNWPEVVNALKAIGYDGWIAPEMIPPVPFYKHHPEVLIENSKRAMDAICN
jgi:L-ribulose-5-phosphate 3-epimerase